MLGPFFAKEGGEQLGPERWALLVDSESYSLIATSNYPSLGVMVEISWIGHDPMEHDPPRTFVTRVVSDAEASEVRTPTLHDARNAHAMFCARYTEQVILLRQGGSAAQREGAL